MTQKIFLILFILGLWTLGSMGVPTKFGGVPDPIGEPLQTSSCPAGESCFGGFPDPIG